MFNSFLNALFRFLCSVKGRTIYFFINVITGYCSPNPIRRIVFRHVTFILVQRLLYIIPLLIASLNCYNQVNDEFTYKFHTANSHASFVHIRRFRSVDVARDLSGQFTCLDRLFHQPSIYGTYRAVTSCGTVHCDDMLPC
jgi:hypothetical protein